MARVIKWDTESQTISTSYSFWRVALFGALLGVIYWGLTVLIGRFINSISISGNIASILVATLGIILMLRFRMAQPLIVAVATGVSLWGLSQWINGLGWIEIIAWSALLYGLAYTLFSWVARYARVVPVLIAIILIIIILRIAIVL
ncbi:MAG TPA: hypothetical protein VFD55_00710 [Candidatus Angelobacter sp.]|nr:hypothetical protein [Candidatus Angelobacter sp.]